MMQKICLAIIAILIVNFATAQKNDDYKESLKAYQKKYADSHEVVKGKNKRKFRFFPVNKAYNITAHFKRIIDTSGFTMNTSAGTQKYFYTYGRLDFILNGKECLLYVYQGKDLMQTTTYKDYLFVPFTDATTGNESYGSGRYLEFYTQDIINNSLQIDFNKAYNPYCAYASGYKCPIPPRENRLTVAVKAGEMNFAQKH